MKAVFVALFCYSVADAVDPTYAYDFSSCSIDGHKGLENQGNAGTSGQSLINHGPECKSDDDGDYYDFARNCMVFPDMTCCGSSYSIAVEFMINEDPGHWSRLFDFGKGRDIDNILATFPPVPDGVLSYHWRKGSGSPQHADVDASLIVYNQWLHYTIVWDSLSQTASVYLDGILTETNSVNEQTSAVFRTSNYLGRSNWEADPDFTGRMRSFKMWDGHALTAAEVHALVVPTSSPTESPTSSPTESPTSSPTASPTRSPTASPTRSPTASPTVSPTETPTVSPTETPTSSPTETPTSSTIGVHADPHVTNARGQHFNLHRSGRFNMLSFADVEGKRVFTTFADMMKVNAQACSPSFVRRVQVVTATNGHIIVRRGFDNVFKEVDEESMNIFIGNHSGWMSHAKLQGLGKVQAGDCHVEASGSGECDENGDQSKCRVVSISSENADLNVIAGVSPAKRRHFLNLHIVRLAKRGLTVSGILWDDAPAEANCQK
jgi:hypothetical protein